MVWVSMKFKLDENTPNILKKILKERGIQDVFNVRDEALGGSSDHILAKVCKEEKRILTSLARSPPPSFKAG